VDVLAHDVGRRAHLEVVELVVARDEVGVVEGDAVARVGAEEEGLGRARAVARGGHVAPERQDARLREVPAGLVDLEVDLDVGRLVGARRARRITLRRR
jgi:hypothetical protein